MQSPTLLSATFACCLSGPVFGNPTGPTVVNGTASFATTGSTLTIANSPSAVINWQTFSIGAGEITRFNQQSAISAVLNRVTTQNPSAIFGALESNGRVFLVNPNGIVFGAGSRVDVAGLVASALNISDADFFAGRLLFTGGGGVVFQSGNVTAPAGGQVYLVGSHVINTGQINAPNGEIVLAAGESVELVNPGTPNLSVQITTTGNQVVNLGQIAANAGRVGIFAGLIDQGGTLSADTAVATEDGRIILQATNDVRLAPGSTTSATGPGTGDIQTQSLAGTVTTTGAGVFANAQGAGTAAGGTPLEAPAPSAPAGTIQTFGPISPSLLSGETISTSAGISGGSTTIPLGTTAFDSTVPTLITGVPTLMTGVPTLITGVPTLTSSAPTTGSGASILTIGTPTVITTTPLSTISTPTTASTTPAPFEATIPLR